METTLEELARLVGGKVVGDPHLIIKGIAGIEDAGPDQITFLANPRYANKARVSRAGAIIVSPEWQPLPKNLIVSADPYLSLAKIASFFAQKRQEYIGVSHLACVDETANIDSEVSIHPFVYVGAGSAIGKGTRIYPGAFVGDKVRIGENCQIYPNVSILDGTVLGDRVIIHSGTVVGSDGFGYAPSPSGYQKIPQVGIVQIDDDVEIGANCTIDRATFGRTWIKKGTKIDNLVQVAHNVEVGEHSILISQVGISGSTKLGDQVILAGQVGVAGHLSIGDRVRVGAQSGVAHSIPSDSDMSGSPAIDHKTWLKCSAVYPRLPQMRKVIRELEQKVKELEQKIDKGE